MRAELPLPTEFISSICSRAGEVIE